MRILLVGGAGTIGRAVAAALAGHEILTAGRTTGDLRVDLTRPESIRELYARVGTVDAVVSAAGEGRFRPLADLTDEDFAFSLSSKLMGQVNLVRDGLGRVRDGGSITVTSGILARSPIPGCGAISLVNSGLEGFVLAAALEAPRGIRVNVVSPPWVTDTLRALGMDPSGGLPPEKVAELYVRSVTGTETGRIIEAG